MNILIFDTETISVDKRFCYNIGYSIVDMNADGTYKEIHAEDYVVSQIWNNLPLFESAYYKTKRPIYIKAMRGRTAKLRNYGHIMRRMLTDIRRNDVQGAFAFNSAFDDSVFQFNSSWYHCTNALDATPIYDIRGHAINFLQTEDYINYCEKNRDAKSPDGGRKFITDSGAIATTAESFTSWIRNQTEFAEDHTALSDSRIETEVLSKAVANGAKICYNYDTRVKPIYERRRKMRLLVNGKEMLQTEFDTKLQKTNNKGDITIYLRKS